MFMETTLYNSYLINNNQILDVNMVFIDVRTVTADS